MASTTATTMTVDELQAHLRNGDQITVIDIREREAREEWSIPGSRHVPIYDEIKEGDLSALRALDVPEDQPAVIVCNAGVTSAKAVESLQEQGGEAMSLEGGMNAWSLAWNFADVDLPRARAQVVQIRRTGKGCLSYLISSEGQALVIDPSLDPQIYLDLATDRGWTITKVVDTHVHADHLMRSRELAARAGATFFLPRSDRADYPYEPLDNGDRIEFGSSTLRVIATPGHTPESASYLLDDTALFTGDTLFLDGVGRPDLVADPADLPTPAKRLFASLQHLLTKLPSETVILPGHTGQPVPFDGQPLQETLGELERKVELLGERDEAVFIEALIERIPETPGNHLQIVEINERDQQGPDDPTELEAGANRCAVS
jgi:glyoxylase-like metal-dependent hydrolase (beta-lactamase superfamily II)/rhodanese-related sulfurtransferase